MILEIASFIRFRAQSWGLRRSTAVEIPTAGAGASLKPRHQSFVADLLHTSSLEELLRLGVEGSSLLDGLEALDLQGGTCLLDGNDPGAALGQGAPLLAHNAAILVLSQVLRCHATHGLRLGAAEHHHLCKPALGTH